MSVSRRQIAQATADLKRIARDGLEKAGLDLGRLMEEVAKMALGYRDLTDPDRHALCSSQEDQFKPRTVTVVDRDTGEERRVIVVDTASKFRAMKLAAEVFELVGGGLSVNINHGNDHSTHQTLVMGERLLILNPSGEEAVDRAIAALPADQRRKLWDELRAAEKVEDKSKERGHAST